MAYLLETNTCVEYPRRRDSAVVARIAATPPDDIRVGSVVKAELDHFEKPKGLGACPTFFLARAVGLAVPSDGRVRIGR